MYSQDFSLFPFITDGIVKDTNDPQQNGRLKIWCPSLDGENFSLENLPWAEVSTPFGGVTNEFTAGRDKKISYGPVSYGFWAMPKIGAQVYVFLLNGDPNRRVCIGSYFGLHRNRSLPAGRNKNPNIEQHPVGPFTDSYDPLQPAYDNVRVAFQNKMGAPQTKTRGVKERQVAQDADVKDGQDGYGPNAVDEKFLDSQVYCFVTPGHHVFLMDDAIDNSRIRLKTCEGNQVIIDDTNERIYVSTAKGRTWIELDEDGHVHVFGSESVSVRAGQDINFYADNDFNIEAKNNVNIRAVNGSIKINSQDDMHLRSGGGSIYATACAEYHICSTEGFFLSAKEINNKAETSIALTASSGGLNIKSSSEINLETNGAINGLAEESVNIKSSKGSGLSLGATTNMVSSDVKIKATSIEMDAGKSLKIGAIAMTTKSNGSSSGTYQPFSTATPVTPSKATEALDSICAEDADGPSVVPGQEPWKRPESAIQRNEFWSE